MPLPEYKPPDDRRACVAAAFAPMGVLLAFAAVVIRLADVDTGLAMLAACAVWVMYEMRQFQRGIDRYNAEYVARHLAGAPVATLARLAHDPALNEATREFVQRYVDAGGQLLAEGQVPANRLIG